MVCFKATHTREITIHWSRDTGLRNIIKQLNLVATMPVLSGIQDNLLGYVNLINMHIGTSIGEYEDV